MLNSGNARAVDFVYNLSILPKFKGHAIKYTIINYVTFSLCYRTSQINVNGFSSKMAEASNGFPQVSGIGPTLFAIYCNDLTFIATMANPSPAQANDWSSSFIWC